MRTITTAQALDLLAKADAALSSEGALVRLVALNPDCEVLMRAGWTAEDGTHDEVFLRDDNAVIVVDGSRISFIANHGDVITFQLLAAMNGEAISNQVAEASAHE